MNERKSLLTKLGETLDQHRAEQRRLAPELPAPQQRPSKLSRLAGWFLHNAGILVVVVLLIASQSIWSEPLGSPSATSISTISYQGRLADTGGNPLTDLYNMEFRIYDVPNGGTPLWEEYWTGGNSVQVSDGLFHIMLGSVNNTLANAIADHDELYLGITVGTDSEMSPRVPLASVPFSMQALTVPDDSITSAKIANDAVGSSEIAANAVGSSEIAANAVESREIANGSVTPAKLDREYIKKSGDTMTGNLNMNGASLYQVGNLYGHGSSDVAELHMPGGSNEGNLYINWHSGRSLVFGGGQETAKFLVDSNGNYWAAGTKSAVVTAGPFGDRKLYALESPDVRFTDEGMNQLQNGVARVMLDPVFLETIEGEYLIHITPYGDASLYVDEVGKDYFIVKVHDGKRDVSFAWRLSAYRKGYSDVRMESINLEKLAP